LANGAKIEGDHHLVFHARVSLQPAFFFPHEGLTKRTQITSTEDCSLVKVI
jgi:hypothetical protein